jgi:hypothetical protein
MLAAEADRRGPTIISGIEELAASGKKDPDRLMEEFLADAVKTGRINPSSAAPIIAAASAFNEGAHAAAEGVGEPSSVGDSLSALG